MTHRPEVAPADPVSDRTQTIGLLVIAMWSTTTSSCEERHMWQYTSMTLQVPVNVKLYFTINR